MPGPLDILQLTLDADHPVHQHPAVEFDLPLAGAAEEAAAAALPLEVGPASHQTAALECHRGKLDLEPAGMGLGAGPEDFKDQRGPVDHLAACSRLEVTLLYRAQTGIDDNQRVIGLFGQFGDPVDIAAAKKGVGARLVERHRLGMDDVEPDGADKLHRLGQHGVGAARQRHGAHVGVDHKCGAGSQSRFLCRVWAGLVSVVCPTGRKNRLQMQGRHGPRYGRRPWRHL